MSIQTQIERINTAKGKIRTKLVDFGLVENTANIDQLAEAVESIEKRGSIQASVVEGMTYTIPAGYHDGTGVVVGMSDTEGDAAKYALQSKSVTPTKQLQSITSDDGYYGLSSVTVEAIPSNYQDVSSVTASSDAVLAGSTFVDKEGKVVAGTMSNNGSVKKTLDTATLSYTIAKGYHDGTGTVNIVTETKSVTPTEDEQVITPTSGNVLSSVTVAAIPEEYIVTTDADAEAGNILVDKTAYVNGVKVVGTMANNGTVSSVLDEATTSYEIKPGYYEGGSVSISVAEPIVVTPERAGQQITAESGQVLGKVLINGIPEEYIVTTDATAVASDLLINKTAYVNGEKVVGTMANNGAVSQKLDTVTTSYTVPAGYHDGKGTVSIETETKSVTPTESVQTITPTSGKLLSSVEVAAIPEEYIVTTDADAVAADILVDKTAYVDGVKVVGTMVNNGDVSGTIDGLSATSFSIPAGYTTGGTISLTSDIEDALAAI